MSERRPVVFVKHPTTGCVHGAYEGEGTSRCGLLHFRGDGPAYIFRVRPTQVGVITCTPCERLLALDAGELIMEQRVKLPVQPRDPQNPMEWQECVNACHYLLVLDDCRMYGLLEGGPAIERQRCIDLLERGAALGYKPERDSAKGTGT